MEEFAAKVQKLAADVQRKVAGHNIKNEAMTKQSLIVPFIDDVLGYKPSEPDEVVTEFTADIGTKQGEKVDYALMHDGSPRILIECKKVGSLLGQTELSQLMRYFTVTDARFGILTDGLVYQFYSDLEKPNVMDKQPFLTFDVRDLDAQDVETIEILKALSKDEFDIDKALTAARHAEYLHSIKQVLQEELSEPSERFLAFMRHGVDADGQSHLIQNEIDSLIRHVCKNFIDEELSGRILPRGGEGVSPPEPQQWVPRQGEQVVVGPAARNEKLRGKTGTAGRVRAVEVQFDDERPAELSPDTLIPIL